MMVSMIPYFILPVNKDLKNTRMHGVDLRIRVFIHNGSRRKTAYGFVVHNPAVFTNTRLFNFN